ncbi:hypothetical protein SAMN04488531_0497 [Corynebacterium coyleae]|uniref:DUF2190 domain-containing protein n=1 Tax=Corynebacterium coyleae TaxID=53374 RepID=A0ABX8KVW0_9CORY|nr:hypothetical protein [Corynebacterium coyleae]QXB18934.1 DUF2190 domain-containing protein [Corynebacterium coyleae]WJY80496.1 hypothetical protein CCOY_09570 [Corynebacterium coyleae]SEB44156.1 hypothetical protein SAMN04488531_0497 [Corynebacterium coyleae]
MYTNQTRDRFNPGTDLTAVAAVDVTGKTFVAYAGPMRKGNITVRPAAAGKPVAGVAKYDATTDHLVGVARGSSRVLTVTTDTPLTAGDPVEVGDGGRATKAITGTVVGWAADNAEANTDALISLAN